MNARPGVLDGAKTLTISILSTVIGGFAGALTAEYAEAKAEAAVRVRPNLADVGFVDALLANHATDWIFYNHPTTASIVTISIVAFVAFCSSMLVIE